MNRTLAGARGSPFRVTDPGGSGGREAAVRDVVVMAEAVMAAEARVAVEREAAAKAEESRAAEAMEAE